MKRKLMMTIILMISMFIFNASSVKASSFAYDDADLYVADCLIFGMINEDNLAIGPDSVISQAIIKNKVYTKIAEQIIEDESLVINSVLWKNAKETIDSNFVTLVDWQRYFYETLLIDFLSYSENSTYYKNDLATKQAKYGFKLYKEYISYSKDMIGDIAIEGLTKDQVHELLEQYGELDKINKYNKILDKILTGYNTANDMLHQTQKALSVQEANDGQKQFLLAIKAVSDDSYLREAIDSLISEMEESQAEITIGEDLDVLGKYSVKTAWKKFKKIIESNNPSLKSIMSNISIGKDGIDLLFNSTSSAENNVKLIILYCMNADAIKALQNLRDTYQIDRTVENAQNLINGCILYINFQKYAESYFDGYAKNALFNGWWNEVFNLLSDENISTYDEIHARIELENSLWDKRLDEIARFYFEYNSIKQQAGDPISEIATIEENNIDFMNTESSYNETLYGDILNLYSEGFSYDWTTDQYEANNLPIVFAKSMYQEKQEMGYCFKDINNDGVDELFAGYAGEQFEDLEYGYIFDAYTIYKGNPIKIIEGTFDHKYALCNDNYISQWWCTEDGSNEWTYSILPEGSPQRELLDTVGYNWDWERGEALWYYYPPYEEEKIEISGEEAEEIQSQYNYQVMYFQPISSYQLIDLNAVAAGKDTKIDDLFTPILDRYIEATSVEENYYYDHVLELMEEYSDISFAAIRGYYVYDQTLCYAFYDIDQNGIDEMLIGGVGDGFSFIFEVYVTDGSNVTPLFLDDYIGERNTLTIFDNGLIEYYSHGGASLCHITFFQIAPDCLSKEIFMQYTGDWDLYPDTPYYNDYEKLSEQEYNEMVSKYSEIDPSWIPFKEADELLGGNLEGTWAEGTWGDGTWEENNWDYASPNSIVGIWTALDNSVHWEFTDERTGKAYNVNGEIVSATGQYIRYQVSNSMEYKGGFVLDNGNLKVDYETSNLYDIDYYFENEYLIIEGIRCQRVSDYVVDGIVGSSWTDGKEYFTFQSKTGRYQWGDIGYGESGHWGTYYIWTDNSILGNKDYGSNNTIYDMDYQGDNLILGDRYMWRQAYPY